MQSIANRVLHRPLSECGNISLKEFCDIAVLYREKQNQGGGLLDE